jgi:cellulose biosynthesis protein BcsQ
MLAQTGGGRNIAFQFQGTIDKLAEAYDYVIIDLSPSISQFNLLMVMVSHYWIAPVFPNRFCYKSMSSMQDIFNDFQEQIAPYKKTDTKKGLDIRYKFLGYVTQNFRRNINSSSGNIVNAFEHWRTKINEEATKLANYLYDFKRSLSITEFKTYFPSTTPYNLSEISDFNRLGAMSQKYGIPAYRLTNDILIKDDEDKDQLKKNPKQPSSDDFLRMKSWEGQYNDLANRLLALP